MATHILGLVQRDPLLRDITNEVDSVPNAPTKFGGLSDVYTGVWHSEWGDMKVYISL